MECFIIENSEYEESIRYYYSLKSETNEIDFEKYINEKENITIDINQKLDVYDDLDLCSDFINFNQNILKEKIEKTEILEFEWNYRIHFMQTQNYYILRIWETSA